MVEGIKKKDLKMQSVDHTYLQMRPGINRSLRS